jgi:hypothetical protein
MATGTALVATTGGAIPEVAGPDGETCLAVPPGDAGALFKALDRVLGDAPLRRRLAVAGRARILARFTWARAAQATAEHYREAIAAQRPAASAVPAGAGAGRAGAARDLAVHDPVVQDLAGHAQTVEAPGAAGSVGSNR